MNEKSLTVLEQYDIEVKETYRTKGNYGCMSDKGKFILQEYSNSEGRMEARKSLGDYLYKYGILCDAPVANKEGKFISVSVDGYTYVLKKWFTARECDIRDENDVLNSVRTLARFHLATKDTREIWREDCKIHSALNIIDVYKRHNKEMVKVRNYIAKRKNKTLFEFELQDRFDTYYKQSLAALEGMKATDYEKMYSQAVENCAVCHGAFNQHSVVFENEMPVIINLRKISLGLQLYDFYGYMRKIMEKNDWNPELGEKVIDAYREIRGISKEEMKILCYMFSYPEKFWKIVNYYYNSNKAWTSDKNEEKLKQFQKQEADRQCFIARIKAEWE